ncbi:MAG: beta-phosphoglucomutase [Oscillospiraceae bacterium]|nr:beta-phosphoglucomutase [Oscillospiraceae bacterium]
MINKKITGVIFDLDGVICHTDKYHYKAWKELADEIGVYFDEEINNRLRGVSRMESLEIVLERSEKIYSQKEKLALAERKNERYKLFLREMSPADLSDEVRVTLDELRSRGFKLTIGSSSKNAGFILGQIGLGDYFDAVSDGNNITNSKPHPEVFIKAADFAGLNPAECIVVEDAEAGLIAAKAAGMTAVAIGWAYDSEYADVSIKSFGELNLLC